ncbi:MAG: hypothetical protein LBM77_01605 [Spirochaetaceae bacterium]|jgi:hypothetical protein|nr:hypothetical protein [Spirochaetaceae bacterium]
MNKEANLAKLCKLFCSLDEERQNEFLHLLEEMAAKDCSPGVSDKEGMIKDGIKEREKT